MTPVPLHSLELLPDGAGHAAVRRDWQALRDAGLPSQLDHQGDTNAPHVTLLEATAIDVGVEALAQELVAPLLPFTVRAAGLVLLGGRRLTVARLAEVPEPVVRAALELRAAVADRRHDGWLPHVTLARRIDRSQVQAAVDAVGNGELSLTITELRRWDPESRSVRVLSRT